MSLPEQADVVVIGGGVIGLSAAFHLAEAGRSVVVLERDALGAGSTSRAAGGVRTAFSDEVNVRLAQRSLAAYERFAADHQQEIDLHRSGYLFLLSDDHQVADFAHASALQRSLGIDSRMIGVDQAAALSPLVDPTGLVGAMWSPDDGHCSPESVVAGYASSARRLDAHVEVGYAATGIEVRDERVVAVVTERGTITTDAVVCAAGAWSRAVGEWVGIDLPVTPLRRHVALSGPVADLDPATPFTIDFATSLYFHREGPGLLLGMPDAEDVWTDSARRDESWLLHLAEALGERVPALGDVGLRIAWAGPYEVTPDHNALIGSAGPAGFVYATGFSGHGFLMGPAVGEVVRDLVLGADPVVDVGALSVDRFASGVRPERHVI